ncbi:MAG: hypothetical protein ACRDWN_01795 [Acidimicrobiales bacterium]
MGRLFRLADGDPAVDDDTGVDLHFGVAGALTTASSMCRNDLVDLDSSASAEIGKSSAVSPQITTTGFLIEAGTDSTSVGLQP